MAGYGKKKSLKKATRTKKAKNIAGCSSMTGICKSPTIKAKTRTTGTKFKTKGKFKASTSKKKTTTKNGGSKKTYKNVRHL